MNAINYGLYELKVRGTVDRLYLKYFPVIGCEAGVEGIEADALEEEPDTARRRLHSTSDTYEVHSASAQHSVGRRPVHRRLKGGGRGDGPDSSEPISGVPQIDVDDFKGLFLVWMSVTAVLIFGTYSCGPISNFFFKRLPQRAARLSKMASRGSMVGGTGDIVIANPDNEMAMLRELVRHIRVMKKNVNGIHDHLGIASEEGHEEDQEVATGKKVTSKRTSTSVTRKSALGGNGGGDMVAIQLPDL